MTKNGPTKGASSSHLWAAARALAGLILVLLLSWASIGHAAEEEDPDDASVGGGTINNVVIATNVTDGRFVSRVRFQLVLVKGELVQNGNLAAAISSCSNCRTVAVAIQFVLIETSEASTVEPLNFAIALNQDCFSCETFAAAYQYVDTAGGRVRLTGEGRQELLSLEQQIRDLAAIADIPFPELDEQIGSLVAEMWAVVSNELLNMETRRQGKVDEDSDFDVKGPSPSPTPTPTDTFTESPTPQPTDSSGSSPSPSPSPSPSESSESGDSGGSPEPSPSPSSS